MVNKKLKEKEQNESGGSINEIRSIMIERSKRKQEERKELQQIEPTKIPVSAGEVGSIADMILNPSQEKILELTNLDIHQVKLIPQLLLLDNVWEYSIEISCFRYDRGLYQQIYSNTRPTQDNLIKLFVYATAQCERSRGGQSLKSGLELVLSELETKREQEGYDEYGNQNMPD